VLALVVLGSAFALDAELASGLVLALATILIPGAVVSRAVFQGSRPGIAEQALLTSGFGIATLTLGGLILNLLPGGLTIQAWLSYLLVVTGTGLAFLGIKRRSGHGWTVRRPLMAHSVASVPRDRIRGKDVVLIGIALGVSTLALAIAGFAAATEPTAPFTELWLVPDASVPSTVQIGVRSSEQVSRDYSVELHSGPTILDRWDVTLDPGATWRMSVPVTGPPTFDKPLEARLILKGTSVPYRSVILRDQSAR
jgi:hypothetical protein